MSSREFVLVLGLGLALAIPGTVGAQELASDRPAIAEIESVIADVPVDREDPPDRVAELGDRRPRKKKARQVDGEVDLSEMNSSEASAPAAGSSSPHHHGAGAGIDPHFSVFFDILLAYQPGKAGFSFLNFHPELFFELVPLPEIMFAFEVHPSPRFYELDWQVSKTIQVRLGKIWIPFDDMNPHNVFGGIISTNRLRLGSVYFLPDIWADLGVGTKINLYDSRDFSVDGQMYVINGFKNQGSADPLGTSTDYPLFTDSSISGTDNNTDKSIGGRLHATIQKIWGVGFSVFHGRWSTDGQDAATVDMIGLDSQLRIAKTELRVGYVTMKAGLLTTPASKFGRSGAYVELNQKFGNKDEWKLLGRAGYVDPDDRFTDENDTMTVGGGLRWKPNLITWSFEHYQDLKKVDSKQGYSFTMLRAVIQL